MVWPGPGETLRRGGCRQVLGSLLELERAGESPQRTSALVSGPSTRAEDGQVLGRPTRWSRGTCSGGMGQLKATVSDGCSADSF